MQTCIGGQNSRISRVFENVLVDILASGVRGLHSADMENIFRHFETYLRQQAAKGCDPKGEYFEGRIDCFFPIAARELLKDGMEPDVLAQFLVSAAHEMMIRDCGLSDQAANDKIIKIAVDLATMLDDPKY